MTTEALQQTEATRSQNADLRTALNFKKTPEETDKVLREYFIEKAAKEAKRMEKARLLSFR